MEESDVRPATDLGDLVAREDWDGVVALLDASWSALIADDAATVRDALAALPDAVLLRYPRWTAARQYVERMLSDGVGTVRFRTVPTGAPVTLIDVLSTMTARAAAARSEGALDAATAAVAEARETVQEAAVELRESLAVAMPELAHQWGATWEAAGDLDRALTEYVDAYDFAILTGNAATESLAVSSLAWVHALAGRNREARSWLTRLPRATGHPWEARISAAAGLTRVLLLLDEGDIGGARAQLDTVDPAATAGRRPARYLLAATLVASPAEATPLLVELDSFIASNPGVAGSGTAQAFLLAARWFVLDAAAESARAREVVATSPIGSGIPSAFLACVVASAAAVAGDDERVTALVRPLRDEAATAPRIVITALALLAVVRLRAEAQVDAAALFAAAAELARTETLYSTFPLVPRADLDALLALVPDGIPAEALEVLRMRAQEADMDPFRTLTPSERRILPLLLTSRTLTEIAEQLVLSANTVKTHTRSIYRKTEVGSRAHLQALAERYGYTA